MQNNHNFNITILLYRFTAFVKTIWQYTYFISLPFAFLQWHGFESRHWSTSGLVSFVRLLLDFKRVVYYEYVCTFIDKRK